MTVLNCLFLIPALLGRFILSTCQSFGRVLIFTAYTVKEMFCPPFYVGTFLKALVDIGFLSLPVVGLTSIFAGGVIALQSWVGFAQYHAQSAVGTIVMLSVTRELGPVLTGLMVAGRIGSALAASIGSMRVTQQIDALKSFGTNPIQYLVSPRVLAGTLAMPFLVLIVDILGIFGGYAIVVIKLGLTSDSYFYALQNAFQMKDLVTGLIKAALFGFLIALMGCYYGYQCRDGAEGVGRAATASVVVASLVLLCGDYVLTDLFFGKGL